MVRNHDYTAHFSSEHVRGGEVGVDIMNVDDVFAEQQQQEAMSQTDRPSWSLDCCFLTRFFFLLVEDDDVEDGDVEDGDVEERATAARDDNGEREKSEIILCVQQQRLRRGGGGGGGVTDRAQ